MSWFRVDDQFHLHRKAHAAGNAALGLWLLLGSYASGPGRSGEIPMRVALTYGTRSQLDRLVDVGLLDRNGSTVTIHDWERCNGALSPAERQRRSRRQRQDSSRNVTPNVTKGRDVSGRPTTDIPDLTTDDDDDVVPRSRPVTSSSSSQPADQVIAIAAHAIGLEQQNTRSGYVRGIANNLRSERLAEIDAALTSEPDPIRAAGIISGSHVLAREAARVLSIETRIDSSTR